MAYQITSEGGANLAPSAPDQLTPEGGANLSPAVHGGIAAEGGADLSPDAPPVLSPAPIYGNSIVIEGDAMVEIYAAGEGLVPRPIAGTYWPTGIHVNGKQTYTLDGMWPHAPDGLSYAIRYDLDAGWQILVYYNSDGGAGYEDGEPNDLASPDLVVDWAAMAPSTGSFTVTAGPSGVVAPPVIVAEGGADLSPSAPAQLVPESSY